MDMGIYIHIPFCISKCLYCDFNSHINKKDIIEKYVNYLKKEISLYSNIFSNHIVNTVFIGGGTPSCISGKYIYEILEHLNKMVNVDTHSEITIEVNPKTLDSEKLSIYRKTGINRISMGVQSFNDNILKQIGRVHSAEDVLQTYKLIRKHGFSNVNFDIMFNLPNQTLDDLLDTLRKTISLDVEHISYYSLKLEEGTPFYKSYEKSELKLPDEDTERDMYHFGINLLNNNGYYHYEISNFSKKSCECKHNLKYWKLKPYVGLGLSAHSNVNNERYGNTPDFNKYFTSIDKEILPIQQKEYINREMEMSEYLILGLRLINGININNFNSRYKIDFANKFGHIIQKHIKQELLSRDEDSIKLTKKGLDLCNLVFMDLLP